LIIADSIHLVDGDGYLRDSDEAQKLHVVLCLFLNTLRGIDNENGGIGLRRARHHVADEFPVSRRIDDDVRAQRGGKLDLRGINRHSLVALGLKTVQQKRPLQFGSAFFTEMLQLFDFTIHQAARIVQQATDQRGFSMVDMTGQNNMQGHMYPRTRSCSKLSSVSLSMARPARSEVFVVSSSAMISSIVEALLATGNVMLCSPSER